MSIIPKIPNKKKIEYSILYPIARADLIFITATEQNKDLLAIAQNCHSIPANLSYKENIDEAETYDKILKMND